MCGCIPNLALGLPLLVSLLLGSLRQGEGHEVLNKRLPCRHACCPPEWELAGGMQALQGADSMHRCTACADAAEDNRGAVDFWHSHALISDATREGLLRTCNFSSIGPLRAQAEDASAKVGPCRPPLREGGFGGRGRAEDGDGGACLLLAHAEMLATTCGSLMGACCLQHACMHAQERPS